MSAVTDRMLSVEGHEARPRSIHGVRPESSLQTIFQFTLQHSRRWPRPFHKGLSDDSLRKKRVGC